MKNINRFSGHELQTGLKKLTRHTIIKLMKTKEKNKSSLRKVIRLSKVSDLHYQTIITERGDNGVTTLQC